VVDERGEEAELRRAVGCGPAAHVGRADVAAGERVPARGGDLGVELREPALEHRVEQVALGLEVVKQPALGDAGLGGDGVEREGLRAVAPDHGDGGVQDAGSRARAGHASASPRG
jgi:hypothetical protein